MYHPIDPESFKSDLKLPWLLMSVMFLSLAIYLLICFTLGAELQRPLPEVTRVQIRTALYIVAILTFPTTNLLRHIQLRLNQTMPLTSTDYRAEAKKRYLVTVLVAAAAMESIGVFGLVLFIVGDDVNNLWILTGLSALGLFAHRPKLAEYSQIVERLATKL